MNVGLHHRIFAYHKSLLQTKAKYPRTNALDPLVNSNVNFYSLHIFELGKER